MVYLLHFSEKFHHCEHYIGFVEKDDDLEERMKKHMTGNGSVLMKHVIENGIHFEIAQTWPGETKTFERFLKNKKHSSRFCPICKKK